MKRESGTDQRTGNRDQFDHAPGSCSATGTAMNEAMIETEIQFKPYRIENGCNENLLSCSLTLVPRHFPHSHVYTRERRDCRRSQ